MTTTSRIVPHVSHPPRAFTSPNSVHRLFSPFREFQFTPTIQRVKSGPGSSLARRVVVETMGKHVPALMMRVVCLLGPGQQVVGHLITSRVLLVVTGCMFAQFALI